MTQEQLAALTAQVAQLTAERDEALVQVHEMQALKDALAALGEVTE